MTVERSAPDEGRRRSVSSEISTGLVQLVRDYTGRGPTKARTYISDNLVTCVLQDSLTRGERMLAELQGHERILDHRKAFQKAMRRDAEALVEQATGRKVIAFLSDNHIEPDVAVETFLLEELPKTDGGERIEDAWQDPGER
jgi:uncharacterized protein YbcI